MFKHPRRIRFHDGDPAGVSFFGRVYFYAHDAYEHFIEHLGFTYKEWFENPHWAIPLRHSEAEYLRPLRPGETYDIQITVEHIGTTSFKLYYRFMKDTDTYCIVRLTHTFFDYKTRRKAELPANIRGALQTYQGQCVSAK